MTAGTRQAARLLGPRARGRLGDLRLVQVRNLEGLRIVADVAGAPLLLDHPRMGGEGIARSDGVGRPGSRDVRRQPQEPVPLRRPVQGRPVAEVGPEARRKFPVDRLVTGATYLGWGRGSLGKI